jgi:hypothetical protein
MISLMLVGLTRAFTHVLVPWGTLLRRSNALWSSHAHSQWFARALVPDGFARDAWMGRDGRPCLHTQSCWPVSARRTLSLDFLRPPSPPSSQAYNFESVLEEITWAYPNTRIRPSFTLVWTGPNSQINGLGVAVFSSCYCYSLLPKL